MLITIQQSRSPKKQATAVRKCFLVSLSIGGNAFKHDIRGLDAVNALEQNRSFADIHDLRVEQGVEELAIFKDVGSEASFASIASFFEDAGRCAVVDKGLSVDTVQVESTEGPPCESGDSLRHDATAPEWFPEPITQFRGSAVDVLPKFQSDAAYGFACTGDGEDRGRGGVYHIAQEFVRIVDCVR